MNMTLKSIHKRVCGFTFTINVKSLLKFFVVLSTLERNILLTCAIFSVNNKQPQKAAI